MNTIREYLAKAKEEIVEAYGGEAADLRLEEFERDTKEIVVSFLLPDINPAVGIVALSAGNRKYERVYKKIEFNQLGDVESVKIYKQ